MKKIYLLILTITIIFSSISLLIPIEANVMLENNLDVPSLDDDFHNDKVILTMTKEYSHVNKEIDINDFLCNNFLYIEDIDIDNVSYILEKYIVIETISDFSYMDNLSLITDVENFCQILCVDLLNENKNFVLKAISEFKKLPYVMAAEPFYIYNIVNDSIPNDILFEEQWGLQDIDMNSSWNFSYGKTNPLIKVGIFEASAQFNHPDLRITSSNFMPSNEESGIHGTHVAGIIGGITNNTSGISGVSQVEIVLLNPFNFVESLMWAINNDIKIINASFAYTNSEGEPSSAEVAHANAIRIFSSNGGILITSAGNNGDNEYGNTDITPQFPAGYGDKRYYPDINNVINVGSINDSLERAQKSNYGINTVHIYAPGEGVLSTFPTHICETYDVVFNDGTRLCEFSVDFAELLCDAVESGRYTWDDFRYNFADIFDGYDPVELRATTHHSIGYHYMDGTSMAAPHVTGVVALLLSMNPNLTVEQIKTAIINGAESIIITIPNGTTQTVKKLNAYNAVKYVLENYLDYPSYTINNSSTDINISKTIYEDASYFNELNGFYELNFGSTKDYCFTISSTNGLEVNLYNSNFEEVAITDLNSSINVFKFNKSFNVGTYYLQVKYNNEELNGTITINGHAHSYTMQYYNYKWHKLTCECGHTSGSNLVHSILQSTIVDDRYAPCIGCGHMLDLNTDMPIIRGQSINNSVMVSNNGSYILPSGIIVLVDEDLELYLNGTLIFYNRNELFMTE